MLKVVGSCKEVSKLASKAMDVHLTFSESFALRFHNLMCKVCRGYTKELKQLVDLAKSKQMEISAELGEERKQRMKQTLEKLISDS